MGVVGPPPQPETAEARTANTPRQLNVRSIRRTLRFRAPKSGIRMKAKAVPASSIGFWKGVFPGEVPPEPTALAVAVGFLSVSMVNVDVAVPETPGVTLAEEKSQTVFLGNVPQARLVAALKPFTDVTVMVTVAGVPALNEPLSGDSAIVKSGGPGQIVTATLLEAEAALLVSPA